MRYFLDGDFEEEIDSRLRYLYEVFGIYFIEKTEPLLNCVKTTWSGGKPSVFVSVPSNYANDICIIYGHNRYAELLLKKHKVIIPETKVFIIACKADVNWDAIKGDKEVFFPRRETDVEDRYSPDTYDMDFPPTDAELNLYNDNASSDKTPFNALLWAFELDR